jgi:RNA polymerase sigma-70 factor, ECF subfamily
LNIEHRAEPSDEALMCAWQAGDGAAFEELYGRYRLRVFRYLARQCPAAVAEELSQDCWLRLIRARAGYVVTARFATWIFRIAHNLLVDHYRRADHAALAAFEDGEVLQAVLEAAPDEPFRQPEAQLVRERLAHRLLAAIEALPAPQREAFLLHQEGEMTVEDIAATTGVGRETAKSRLRYALARLRTSLREEQP